MTAMELFKHYAVGEDVLDEIRTKIERRKQMASGCTSQSFSSGGSRSSGDASMKILDYMNNIEALERQLADEERKRASDRACCVYLAELLPEKHGHLMILRYLDGKTIRACADTTHYSESHIRRLLNEAESMCRDIELTWWDGIHIPVTVIRHTRSDMQSRA